MSLLRRALALVAVVAAVLGIAIAPANAAGPKPAGHVYVLGNQAAGNAVLAYDRAADGSLSFDDSYPTGGTGTGGGLGSQGAVILDHDGHHLYAVNAGSDSISSFRVRPDGLELIDVVPSGGTRPTSLTIDHDVLYVLNAGGTGQINGFAVHKGDLSPLAGSARPLSGAATAPAQVSFSPDGRQLVVTERATQLIDLYSVGKDGLAAGPVTQPSAGPTPFGFGFAKRDTLIVSEAFGGVADASAVSSYQFGGGSLTAVSPSVPTTETAACWIAVTPDGRYAYAGNAGTSSVTGYAVAPGGSLTILDADGKTGTASAGVTDLAVSDGGRYLYGRVGDGSVAVWAIRTDGSLADLGPVGGLPSGAAGIAAR